MQFELLLVLGQGCDYITSWYPWKDLNFITFKNWHKGSGRTCQKSSRSLWQVGHQHLIFMQIYHVFVDLFWQILHNVFVKAELNSTKFQISNSTLHVSVLTILMEYTSFVILKILCLLVTVKTVFYIDFVVESVRLFLLIYATFSLLLNSCIM